MEPKTHCMRHCAQKSTENDADRQSFGHIRRINYKVEKIRQLTHIKTNSNIFNRFDEINSSIDMSQNKFDRYDRKFYDFLTWSEREPMTA